MKFKINIPILILSLFLSFALVGCFPDNKDLILNKYQIIHSYNDRDPFGNVCNRYLTYDLDTKIVYEIVVSRGINIREVHGYDDRGHPVLQFYKDGEIVYLDEFLDR